MNIGDSALNGNSKKGDCTLEMQSAAWSEG